MSAGNCSALAERTTDRRGPRVLLASLTSFTSSLLTAHGALALALVLAVDAVLPVGGELPMLLAGAVAAGAVGDGTSVFGAHVASGLPTYIVLASAGTLGYLAGSVAGWAIGRRGGPGPRRPHRR